MAEHVRASAFMSRDYRYSVYLLSWYKNTNTDTEHVRASAFMSRDRDYMYSVYLLYWYKSTNTDTGLDGARLYSNDEHLDQSDYM